MSTRVFEMSRIQVSLTVGSYRGGPESPTELVENAEHRKIAAFQVESQYSVLSCLTHVENIVVVGKCHPSGVSQTIESQWSYEV